MRRLCALALTLMALLGTLVFTTQPAQAAPDQSSAACVRSKQLTDSIKDGAYVPKAVVDMAAYHCSKGFRAAAKAKLPSDKSVQPVKAKGPCPTISTDKAEAGRGLESQQADCIAKWAVTSRVVATRPDDCIKRDNAVLQGKSPGDLEQKCQKAASNLIAGQPSQLWAGIIIVALLAIVGFGFFVRRPIK